MPKVRKAIEVVEADGWYFVRQRGSHRIFHHPRKEGIVVIAGRPSKDLPSGIWNGIVRQAGLKGRGLER